MQPQLQIPQTQQHHLQLQHPSKTTRHPSTLSPQELDLDYDYDDIDIFPTGLTPDLTWIDLPVAARNADTADISTSNLSVRDAFDILDISLPDPVVWSPYESSASRSASSTPSHQPTAEALSRSSSPSTATVTATATNTLSDDSFQFINAAPVAAGTGTGMTLTTPPEPGPGPQTRSNLLLLPKSTATSSPTGTPFDSSLAKTRGVSKRQLNTEAARRYRQRKVDRMNQLEEELELIKKERDELRMRVSKLAGETEGLKSLLDVKT
ncbi:hypothetical protein BJX68DRAFT_109376 [Aspergillus pseudodeflectus]|uniref:BZIP domain-containing protein n=1 Tax=Aspergillus pseudodeflectus TaxID=176178 RepID=A0ABR4K7I7_9EURO